METLERLEHEYSLREELDPAWAARPIETARYRDSTVLVLDDPGGASRSIAQPVTGRTKIPGILHAKPIARIEKWPDRQIEGFLDTGDDSDLLETASNAA